MHIHARRSFACSVFISGVVACGAPKDEDTTTTDDPMTTTSIGSTTDHPPSSSTDSTGLTSEGTAAADTGTTTLDTDGPEPTIPPEEELFACMLEDPCGVYLGNGPNCDTDPESCVDPPVWAPQELCLFELLRDAASGGISAQLDGEYGGEPDYVYIYGTDVLREDATVLRQTYFVDLKFGGMELRSVVQCGMQPSELFQSCLDDPQWDCLAASGWYVDCVEVETFECTSP